MILQEKGCEVAYKNEKNRSFSGKKTTKMQEGLTPYHVPDTIGTSEIKKRPGGEP